MGHHPRLLILLTDGQNRLSINNKIRSDVESYLDIR
jgi:hypothetical protein